MPEYALNNVKWGEPAYGSSGGLIYYSITFGAGLMYDTTRYSLAQFESALEAAFQAWEDVADVDFEPAPSGTSADVGLGVTAIDGVGQVVGDATYHYFTGMPGTMIDGTIRFDSAETWSPFGETALSFYAVAVHEIGHILGLDHVADPDEIMYPVINQNDLGPGDIEGVQVLYGPVSLFEGTAGADVIDRSAMTTAARIYGFAGADVLTGGSANDRIYGGTGSDISNGGAGDDLLLDMFGADTLNGGADDDLLVSGADDATQNGDGGADVLLGGFASDLLSGGAGNDILIGDAASARLFGNDRLNGGAGDDLLEGGLGADTFVFAPGDGTDVVGTVALNLADPAASTISGVDFDPLADRIDLTAFGFSSVDDIFAAISDNGGSAEFSAADSTFTLFGVTEAELLADTFIF